MRYLSGLAEINPLAIDNNPQGRITPTTAVPVITAAATAVASVFYTPYLGNKIPLWNGFNFEMREFTELTNTLASTTPNHGPAAGAASKNYDLFVHLVGGVPALTRGAAWFSDTARSTAAENDLQRVKGRLVNLNAITNGPAAGYGTYVGTIRTDAGGATVTHTFATSGSGGAAGTLGVWNMYNRKLFRPTVIDTTASWTQSSSTPAALNGSNSNRINFINGLVEDINFGFVYASVTSPATSGAFFLIGIGLDVTNAISSKRGQIFNQAAVTKTEICEGIMDGNAGLGFHFYQAIQAGDNANTFTVNGNNGVITSLHMEHWC